MVPADGAHAKVELLKACMKCFGKKDVMNAIKKCVHAQTSAVGFALIHSRLSNAVWLTGALFHGKLS